MATPAITTLNRVWADDDGTFTSGSYQFEFLTFGVQKNLPMQDASEAGIRGNLARVAERVRSGPYTVGGTITMNPSPNDLNYWLPHITGDTDGTPFTTGQNTLSSFSLLHDVDNGTTSQINQYDTCYVNRALLRSEAGGFMELEMDIIGTTATGLASLPSGLATIGTAADDGPFLHSDAGDFTTTTRSLTITGLKVIEIEINNFVEPQFTNSTTATAITPVDKLVTVSLTGNYNDLIKLVATDTNNDIDDPGMDTEHTGGSITYSFSSMSVAYTFGGIHADQITPTVDAKGELDHTVVMVARRDDSVSTAEVSIALDHAP